MDRQKEIFDKLVFGPFPGNIASILFSNKYGDDVIYRESGYRILEPIENGRKIEHDMILLLTKASLHLKKVKQRDSIAIEIKTSSGDIMESDVKKYLGATRLFFIASPKYLLPDVVSKYCNHSKKSEIGMIDSDSGEIVVLPRFQNYSKTRLNTVFSHCYTSGHRIPCLYDTEPYTMARVAVSNYSPVFKLIDGLMVNTEYIHFFK